MQLNNPSSKSKRVTLTSESTLFAAPEYDAKIYRLLMDYSMRILGRKQYSVRELTNKMRLKLKRLEKYLPKGRKTREDSSGENVPAVNSYEERKDERDGEQYELAIHAVIAKLQEWNYLSDKKIIDSAIDASTSYKPQGKNAFVFAMMKKGIDKDQARDAWYEKAIDERALAKEVVKKYSLKYRKLDAQARKRRLAGVLARKGFSGDVIWSSIGEIE